jgi:lantibiotic leader peptide-processing serine protease
LRSTAPTRKTLLAAAAATAVFALVGGTAAALATPGDLPNTPVTDADPFFVSAAPPVSGPGQWNTRLIQAPQAHEITGGSPAIVVAVVDTGIDYSHPDLADHISFEDSLSCVGGVRDRDPAAWRDDNGHGTHNAGIIAAGANGVGIVGVAPNVRLAAIKVTDATGLTTPDAVECAYRWIAARKLDVANNSYSVDVGQVVANPANPLDLFCRDDAGERRALRDVSKAIRHAMDKGVTVVASAGNSNADVAAAAAARGEDCARLPSGVPGVVTVSSTGTADEKSAFSNYGAGYVDVAAPGGNIPPAPPAGFVLSTWPMACPTCPEDPGDGAPAYYRFMAGTSSAAAHASGVAALIVSRYGSSMSPGNGHMDPAEVESILRSSADPLSCPAAPTTCTGAFGDNSFFGAGRVNAFQAVTLSL